MSTVVLNTIFPLKLRLACWNVLADCYSVGQAKSLIDLDWNHRKDKIKGILADCNANILCLQEIDHYDDFYKPFLEEMGMESVYYQRPHREDGCLIAYSSSSYQCIEVDNIDFDHLAASIASRFQLSSSSSYYSRFVKHNVALSLKLQEKSEPNRQFIVSCGHLYWNPNKPEVKLAQTIYWLDRIRKFASSHVSKDKLPVVIAGDFNSLPDSEPHRFILNEIPSYTDTSTCLEQIHISTSLFGKTNGQAKFLCDPTLGKLCRWMRALGIDVAIDKEFANAKNVNRDYSDFFARARRENRVILTTSRTMRERAACPRSTLVNTLKLEDSLVEICQEYSITLDRERILTVCGKCGGEIESCEHNDERFVGKFVPEDRPVFICVDCNQPYWWNDKEDSSPARAMKVADRLFSYVSTKLSAESMTATTSVQVGITEESNIQVDVLSEDEDESKDAIIASEHEELSELFEIRNQAILSRELGDTLVERVDSEKEVFVGEDNWRFRSVFQAIHGEEPKCTNWSGDFFGTLDYIFTCDHWTVIKAECFPQIDDYRDSHASSTILPSPLESITITESQPSSLWPSDHFMLVSELEIL